MIEATRPKSSAHEPTPEGTVSSRKAAPRGTGLASWLPDLPARPAKESLRSWKAPSLTEKGVDQRSLTYVILEEMVGNTVGLSLYPWPAADPEGRLRFETDREPVEVAVTCEEFCGFLSKHELGFVAASTGRSEDRELRSGDVFAVRIEGPPAGGGRRPLAGWRDVYDISSDAREVAKLAYYGALTEKWEWKHAQDLLLTEPPEEEP
jgi:hypothetical protein